MVQYQYKPSFNPWDFNYQPSRLASLLEYEAELEAGDVLALAKQQELLDLMISDGKWIVSRLEHYKEWLDIHGKDYLTSCEEVSIPESLTPPTILPSAGMPWNTKWKSGNEVKGSEWVDREILYTMTQREDLLSSDE